MHHVIRAEAVDARSISDECIYYAVCQLLYIGDAVCLTLHTVQTDLCEATTDRNDEQQSLYSVLKSCSLL